MKQLNADPRRPQFNKVVGGGYPPASTFKMAVMLAALKHKVIKPDDKILCTGKVNLGDRDFIAGNGAVMALWICMTRCSILVMYIFTKSSSARHG